MQINTFITDKEENQLQNQDTEFYRFELEQNDLLSNPLHSNLYQNKTRLDSLWSNDQCDMFEDCSMIDDQEENQNMDEMEVDYISAFKDDLLLKNQDSLFAPEQPISHQLELPFDEALAQRRALNQSHTSHPEMEDVPLIRSNEDNHFLNVSADQAMPAVVEPADCCNAFDEENAKINENDSTFISFCSEQNNLLDNQEQNNDIDLSFNQDKPVEECLKVTKTASSEIQHVDGTQSIGFEHDSNQMTCSQTIQVALDLNSQIQRSVDTESSLKDNAVVKKSIKTQKHSKTITKQPKRNLKQDKPLQITQEEKKSKKTNKREKDQWDFFYKRTAFRLMLLYFKRQFGEHFEMYRNQHKLIEKQLIQGPAKPFNEYLQTYTQTEFPSLMQKFTPQQGTFFQELVKLVSLSHRYNKEEEVLANPVVPFDQIRDVAYKFSERAKDKFFEEPLLAFIFAWYATSASGKAFMDQKAQEDAKNGKFIVEALEVLTEEALETLQGQQTLITYLEMNKANI